MDIKEFKYIAPGIEVLRFDVEGVICDSTGRRPGDGLIYDDDDF